jgi:type III restriction enzyme
VVKKHLLENEGVKEEEIAIATGNQHELDGLNLFDKMCPIKVVITIEALKEGWDCSFAYVFCSVANIRSEVDTEQLLGRVMRMPYARRRRDPELNKAYAHFISRGFGEAADRIYGNLLHMGFDEEEAAANIQPALPGVDLGSLPLLRPEPPTLELDLPKAPKLDDLPEEEREAITVMPQADGSVKVKSTAMLSREAEEAIVQANRGMEEVVRRKVSRHRAMVRAVQPPSPAERGETIRVPQLSFELWGSREPLEPETVLLAADWKPTDGDVRFEPGEFEFDETARTFVFDLEGERMRYTQAEATIQFTLLATSTDWDEAALHRWLMRECHPVDQNQRPEVLLEFCRRCVASLLERGGFDLPTLCRAKFGLATAMKAKLGKLKQEAMKKGIQLLLGNPGHKLETSFFHAHRFPAGGYAEGIQAYSGPYGFKKHLYKEVRDLKRQGEEFVCARELDAHPQVKWWVRNVDRQPGSFWLPLSSGRKFYPDFVALLQDSRLLVVEHKGGHLESADDAKEKNGIGALWEAKSNGTGLFLMTAKRDANGRDVFAQIQAKIK